MEDVPGCECSFYPARDQSKQLHTGGMWEFVFSLDFPGTEVPAQPEKGPIDDDWMVSAPVTMMNALLVSNLIP